MLPWMSWVNCLKTLYFECLFRVPPGRCRHGTTDCQLPLPFTSSTVLGLLIQLCIVWATDSAFKQPWISNTRGNTDGEFVKLPLLGAGLTGTLTISSRYADDQLTVRSRSAHCTLTISSRYADDQLAVMYLCGVSTLNALMALERSSFGFQHV